MTGASGGCHLCGAETDQRFGGMWLCRSCEPDDSADERPASAACDAPGDETAHDTGDAEGDARPADTDSYADVSFASDDLARDEWPAAHRDVDAWMCRKDGKAPWSPWTAPDAPVECTHGDHDEPTRCDRCRHSARFKWGSDGSRDHVHADYQTAREWRDKHPEARDDLAFIQREADPFVFVDGDDVRDPDTGEVHPAFLDVLDRLGVTYTDVSQSGSGVHAMYRGELPDGVKQVQVALDDEPFVGDDTPDLEIYDGKHVCIATGDHVAGTGLRVEPWDDDAVEAVLDEHGLLPDDEPAVAFDDFDPDGYDADATTADETAHDIRDVFAAVDRLDARRVAAATIVHGWNESASTSGDHRAFVPTWGPSANGTANIVNRERWVDTGGNGYGGPVSMAAIDAGLVEPRNCPERVDGETWMQAVDHLRGLGFSIPELADDGDTAGEPVVATPLKRLDALDRDEARRFARKNAPDFPTTREARERLRDRLFEALRHGDNQILDAPTALGKSYTVATEPWRRHADVTGDAPVVMFHKTREARDQAVEDSREAGVDFARLLGRSEACACAAGDHDPAHGDDEADPAVVVTVDGEPASEWLARMCDRKGLPFSLAHKMLADRADQDHDQLPCEGDVNLGDGEEGGTCRSVTQWNGIPRTDDGDVAKDVIHATHNFAHVPSLRNGVNVVFDERPDFRASLSADRVREAVTAYLDDAGAPVRDFERFVARARDPDQRTANEQSEHAFVAQAFDHEPDREWYVDAPGAHTLAPALTRAIWYALDPDDDGDTFDANGRTSASVPHEPPRLDAEASDADGWNREYVSVVLDDQHTIRHVRATPHFGSPDSGGARAVVGLDAHPTLELWQMNVHPDIRVRPVLGVEERRLWRQHERGLLVAQVGDATRPYTSGEYFDRDQTGAFLRAVRERFGERFDTAITAAAVEREVGELLADAGVDDPETMHYGEEKSRGDFGDRDVGAVLGCIDPGDDYVLDLLAERGLSATPETTDDGQRAHGRGFSGADAGAADALLASVREQHVAQAAGRYARNADDPDDRAVVFVRTDATPTGFVDAEVSGVEWVATDRQRDIVAALLDQPTATTAEIADHVDASREHVRQTLARLVDAGVVEVRENAGEHGAHVYRALSGLGSGDQVTLTPDETSNDPVCNSYTWSLAIRSPDPTPTRPDPPTPGAGAPEPAATADARGSDPPE